MPLDDLRYTPLHLTQPHSGLLTAETALDHFAIVTFHVEPAALARHLHPRFEADLVALPGVGSRALISVVTFVDRDFRFVAFPWAKRRFGQTNYRAYVRDTETGEHVAWFFGTCLASSLVLVPRHLWRLPWHRARMTFECTYDEAAGRYTDYAVTTTSDWALARLVLADTGRPPTELPGFTTLEAGLVLLTHPLRGFYHRRDGRLGTYSIWHDRMAVTLGSATVAAYPLLDRLGLVPTGDLATLHSVLLQRSVDFSIHLPPLRMRGSVPCLPSDRMRH